MHQTRIFVVFSRGLIEPLAHANYVKLLRGELAVPEYANQSLRIADWYVEIREGKPVSVHNETYSLLHFDEHGRVRWAHERHGEAANKAFYQALRSSSYSDPDEDPAVRQLRRELHSEFAWTPSVEERHMLRSLAFRA